MRRFKVWIKRVGVLLMIFSLFIIVEKIFGANNPITSFIKNKVVFTPFNIVGVIMVMLAPFSIWVGKKRGGKLLSIISSIALLVTIFSFIVGVLTLFNSGIVMQVQRVIQKVLLYIGASLLAVALFIVVVKIIKFFVGRKDNKISGSRVLYRNHNTAKLQNQFPITTTVEKSGNIIAEEPQSEVCDSLSREKFFSGFAYAVDLGQEQIEEKEPIICIDNYEYKIANKICPKCGAKLKSRQNHENLKWFMGCENYFTHVDCDFTIDYALYKRIQEQTA